jgi:maltodextrin utilization protein YvdJ
MKIVIFLVCLSLLALKPQDTKPVNKVLDITIDTVKAPAKETATFNKIDQKTNQINKSLHTNEDVYILLNKAVKTLNESHDLTKSVLLKKDSALRVATQSQEYLKTVLLRQNELKDELHEKNPMVEQFKTSWLFMDKGVYLAFTIIVVYLIFHILVITGEQSIKEHA